MKTFKNKSYAKCIIAGEHAVLRGSPAVVFPVHSCYLQSDYQATDQEFEVNFTGPYAAQVDIVFWGLVEKALSRVDKKRKDMQGNLEIYDQIPIGGGLGASATICVTIGRLMENLGFINSSDLYEFARSLEDIFHGESSGVDIAAAMSETGLLFMRGGEVTPINLKWQPNWYLSYSGKKSVTSECVKKVKELFINDSSLAEQADQEMADSARLSIQSLESDKESGFDQLKQAIQSANDCFYKWGLVDDQLSKHMEDLRRQGAVAVKPTGSGDGGYVLSLWPQGKAPQDSEKFLSI